MGLETTEGLTSTVDDMRLHPFLPLVYVASADLELSNDEVEGVCQIVAEKTGIDIDCQVALQRWLDIEDLPSPHELELLRLKVARSIESLDLNPDVFAIPRAVLGAPPAVYRSA